MRIDELRHKKIVIWGVGREGKAAAAYIHKFLPQQPLTFVDENKSAEPPEGFVCATGDQIEAALNAADIVIKSPGVSLYHPLIEKLKKKKTPVTSLLNLWAAEARTAMTIGVTGTKGKSTTASLLAHTLAALGKTSAAAGNIGIPVTDVPQGGLDYVVVEMSSYQAADFSGAFDIGILTSLYPEHLDWHRSLDAYYRDKLNLLAHSKKRILNFEALETLKQHHIDAGSVEIFGDTSAIHVEDGQIYDRDQLIGAPTNKYLSRPHNLINVCAVLAVIRQLRLDLKAALHGMEDYKGLPHRQQELLEKNGILYIDDSISTTPQSAIAALETYAGRPITLIAGGYDRGIDYNPLTDYILHKKVHAVICLGPSGQRIFDALKKGGAQNVHTADSMKQAVDLAKINTSAGGAVLLSPAAPSYGMFKDFEERGDTFAACVKDFHSTTDEKRRA